MILIELLYTAMTLHTHAGTRWFELVHSSRGHWELNLGSGWFFICSRVRGFN